MIHKTRSLTKYDKEVIAGRQLFRCINRPGSNYVPDYDCPLWKRTEAPGNFDETLYEVDHNVEFAKTKDDSYENCFAICVGCHNVKTRRFLSQSRKCKPKTPRTVVSKYFVESMTTARVYPILTD